MTFELQYWMVAVGLGAVGILLGSTCVHLGNRTADKGFGLWLAACAVAVGCLIACPITAVDAYREAESPRIVEEGRGDRRAGLPQEKNPYPYGYRRESWDRGWREENRRGK